MLKYNSESYFCQASWEPQLVTLPLWSISFHSPVYSLRTLYRLTQWQAELLDLTGGQENRSKHSFGFALSDNFAKCLTLYQSAVVGR
jgi:hypothetical protein